MAKYLLAYKGGGMAETDEAREAAMAAWGAWFTGLGDSVVDMGAPFGGSASVGADGSTGTAGSALTGYSVVTASSLDDAVSKAGGCPIFANGGEHRRLRDLRRDVGERVGGLGPGARERRRQPHLRSVEPTLVPRRDSAGARRPSPPRSRDPGR